MAERRIPDLFVEKALLGDTEAQQAMAALSDEERAEVSARMAELAKDNAAILDRYPAARIKKEVERRYAESKQPARRWALAMVPALAAASLAVIFATGGLGTHKTQGGATGSGPTIGSPESDDILLKGGAPELHIYKKREGQKPELLGAGSAVRPGDVVQLSYSAAGRCCGVIVSIDGRGTATLHHPAAATEPALLQAGGEVPLAKAYALDDAPQFERFFFITSRTKQPIDAQAVLAAAQKLAHKSDATAAPLELGSELAVSDVLLRKETAPAAPKANP